MRLCCPNMPEEMPKDEQKHKQKQTHRKKSRNPMLRRVPPRFAPGWSQVPPRLTRFGRGWSAAGGASFYNLRLPPKASGKGTGCGRVGRRPDKRAYPVARRRRKKGLTPHAADPIKKSNKFPCIEMDPFENWPTLSQIPISKLGCDALMVSYKYIYIYIYIYVYFFFRRCREGVAQQPIFKVVAAKKLPV